MYTGALHRVEPRRCLTPLLLLVLLLLLLQPLDLEAWCTATCPLEVQYLDLFEVHGGISVKQQLPPYSEDFRGYGLNKQQHAWHAAALGFRFLVSWHTVKQSYLPTATAKPICREDEALVASHAMSWGPGELLAEPAPACLFLHQG